MTFKPAYLINNYLKLNEIANKLFKNYINCSLCPLNCSINRFISNKGACKESYKVKIASFNLHFGEEPPISGKNGSGTIFFSGCPLSCIFCQNYPISQYNYGNYFNIANLAEIMIKLQNKKAHNINLVTPTHFSPSILKAILLASKMGLSIPIAYNTSGYEKPEIIDILTNFIDIFLFDIKYFHNSKSILYSRINNYFFYSIKSFKVLFDKIGETFTTENGILKKGIIIRHLILPGEIDNSKLVLKEISKISKKIYISLMSQYFPAFNAFKYKNLSTKLTSDEYEEIVNYAIDLGLENVYIQDL